MNSVFGVLSVIVAAAGYVPYFRDIRRGRTKPHALSWLVWSLLPAIAFGIQLDNGGGAGCWLQGGNALATFAVFVLAVRAGERNITPLDWITFGSAIALLITWSLERDDLTSVVLISAVELLAFGPTVRKSLQRPDQETAITYGLYASALCLSVLALGRLTLVNLLYPVVLGAVNAGMAAFLMTHRIRRQVTPARRELSRR